MSNPSASKRAKLTQLLEFKSKLPAHSQEALESILKEAKKSGIPELVSSNAQKEARLQLLAECHGSALGPLILESTLELEDGTKTPFHYTNFLVYIMALYHRDTSFTQLVQNCHTASPSTMDRPWGLILYCDEIVPGNVLGRAERKCWCIYASIDAFQQHLANESAWLTLAVERSSFVSTLNGGVSQMVAAILTSIFCCQLANPMLGFTLKSPKGDCQIFFHFKMMLCDGAAHKQVWCSKGDSGDRFCTMCSNVRSFAPPEALPNDAPDGVEVLCQPMAYNQLNLVTDEELLASWQRLNHRKHVCTKAEFARWQMATGLSWSKHALALNANLLDAGILKPISQFCHDWMHGILQGTAPVVLWHLLQALGTHFDIWHFLEQYFQNFQFPAAYKCGYVHTLFSKKKLEKCKKNFKFSCTASEVLAIFPIIRHFLHVVVKPQDVCQAECQAFLAMAELIDQCHGGTPWKIATRSSLIKAAENASQAFVAAWPAIGLIKKWHWQLHLGDAFDRFGHLPSCFTTERKHKTISSFATRLLKTTSFEAHLLQQVVSNEIMHLQHLDQFPMVPMLLKPKAATLSQMMLISIFLSTPCNVASISNCAKLPAGGQICNGDMILYHAGSTWEVAQVKFHVLVFGIKATLVQRWPMVEYFQHEQYVKCQISPHMGLIPMESILFPVTFAKGNDEAKVLLTYQIYGKDNA